MWDLVKIDASYIPEEVHEVRLFAIIRNEILRLPYFLAYYRKLGVQRFFFVVNDTTDGSLEYLISQADCHVFLSRRSYKETKGGSIWRKHMLDSYGVGFWCVVVDADELLVYPACEHIDLISFCGHLDQEQSRGLFSFLIDMYADIDMDQLTYRSGDSFFEACAYFDTDYDFLRKRKFLVFPDFPDFEVLGGPRSRCFFPPQRKRNHLRRFFIKLDFHIREWLISTLNVPVRANASLSPALFKIPLVKWNRDLNYYASTHKLTPIRLSGTRGALAHFKFLPDFKQRVDRAVEEKNYVDESIEYTQYKLAYEGMRKKSFIYPGSARYVDSESYVGAGLIHASPAYEAFVRREKSND